jgi:hypothetical protein
MLRWTRLKRYALGVLGRGPSLAVVAFEDFNTFWPIC